MLTQAELDSMIAAEKDLMPDRCLVRSPARTTSTEGGWGEDVYTDGGTYRCEVISPNLMANPEVNLQARATTTTRFQILMAKEAVVDTDDRVVVVEHLGVAIPVNEQVAYEVIGASRGDSYETVVDLSAVRIK
jgi:hypothetical protein